MVIRQKIFKNVMVLGNNIFIIKDYFTNKSKSYLLRFYFTNKQNLNNKYYDNIFFRKRL